MKGSIVAVGLVAVVAAQNPFAVSQLSVLSADLKDALSPPSSILPELLSGVPSNVISAFDNPTALPSLVSSLEATPPAWFTALPSDAQHWIIGAEEVYASLEPQIASLEAIVGGITAPGGTGATGSSSLPKSTSYSNSTITSTKSSTSATTKATSLTASPAVVASSSSKATSSSSSGGAASPTGAVAAGVMGAVGLLGLALAL
ncbi:uncharacterized protein LY89DRAFT_730417 [Mollisia scopiformis]|uniref:Uncharacterized protein n=1 Tax=Mollisia scopiformis TaxID=149040 RepID=A0A194XJR2_MOLSC|nr:uncharacterized protein LY89DRAFT_730417 [Mollisia scopiformis]KUJ20371.1 hypothetical protein LY89DRAFT_730417 [Mollisia scopiformis]